MAKTVKTETPKSKFKAKVEFQMNGNTATVYRPEMPFIVDRTEKVAPWLKNQGFKAEEIEIIGEKPAGWDEMFINPILEG
jgi:hypothetical protein